MILRVSGTAQQVREQIAQSVNAELGQIHGTTEALVILEHRESKRRISEAEFAQLMAEAAADAVAFGRMDDSREAMYTRAAGE